MSKKEKLEEALLFLSITGSLRARLGAFMTDRLVHDFVKADSAVREYMDAACYKDVGPVPVGVLVCSAARKSLPTAELLKQARHTALHAPDPMPADQLLQMLAALLQAGEKENIDLPESRNAYDSILGAGIR